MIKTRTVKLYDIKYDDRTKYISVCGREQLQSFFESGSMSCYDSESAPKEYLVKITADFGQIDQVSDESQKVAEEELGLTIKSFKLIY